MTNTIINADSYVQPYATVPGDIVHQIGNKAYHFYLDGAKNFVFDICDDMSLATPVWDGQTVIDTLVPRYASFAEWKTPGNTGTSIWLSWFEYTAEDWFVQEFSTSTDAMVGSPLSLKTELSLTITAIDSSPLAYKSNIGITIARGGALHVAANVAGGAGEMYHARATGDYSTGNWTSRTAIHEDGGATTTPTCILLPGNETDLDDIYAMHESFASNLLTIKHYDHSANTVSVVHTPDGLSESAAGMFMTGITDPLTFDHYMLWWNLTDSASGDLVFCTLTDAATISSISDVVTNQAESGNCSLTFDPTHRRLYSFYCGDGSGTYALANDAFMRYSDDLGATWSASKKMSDDGATDAAWGVHTPSLINTDGLGAHLRPIWFEMDADDVTYNLNPDVGLIQIAASAPPTIVRNDNSGDTVRGATRFTVRGSGSETGATQTLTPSAVALTLAAATPTVVQSQVMSPDAVAFSLAVAAPAINLTFNVDVVALTLAVPAPTAGVAAGTQTATPDAVAVTLAVATPTVNLQQVASVDAVTVTLGAVTPTVVQQQFATPDAVGLTLAVPTPSLFAQQIATPTPVTFTLAPAAPVVALVYNVTPTAVAVTLAAPAPVINFTQHPTPVTLTLGAATPQVNFTQYPTPVALSLAIPTLAILYAATVPLLTINVRQSHLVTVNVKYAPAVTTDVEYDPTAPAVDVSI